MNADLYWVVAHYEGVSVAAELLSMGKSVHLTVHDEPLAMLIRSRRFRPLWPLMSLIFPHVLRGAHSVDVTSTSMRDYFKLKYRVNCFALYKYLSELPEVNFHLSEKVLTVGHIGSLYHPDPFRKFVLACRSYATKTNRSLKIVRIGDSPEMDKIAAENLATFENHENCSRKTLCQCSPPATLSMRCTRTASASEVFAGRAFQSNSPLTYRRSALFLRTHPPIADWPNSSTNTLWARVCSSHSEGAIQHAIHSILQAKITRDHFEALRSDLMGPNQLLLLRDALTGKNLA